MVDGKFSISALSLVLMLASSTTAMDYRSSPIGSENAPTRDRAIAALRNRGPEGLQQALQLYDKLLAARSSLQEERQRVIRSTRDAPAAQPVKSPIDQLATIEEQISNLDSDLKQWQDALDRIGGQRSCTVSRLFWYTDWEAAQAEARRTGRPILSLRMLGRLTDEFSCANSRFFRTTLYSNEGISDFLRDNFVLHWRSVRPVPRVTIDFGDGRKLNRTLTGNSAHYVLTSDGEPLDVLPGLYSPQQFQDWIGRMLDFHAGYVATAPAQRPALLQAFHTRRRGLVLERWNRDIERVGGERAELVRAQSSPRAANSIISGSKTASAVGRPTAFEAARLTASKAAVEAAPLQFVMPGADQLERAMGDELWQAIADLYRGEVSLDESSVELMRSEFPRAREAGRLAEGKRRQEDPVLRMVRAFEDSIAVDTIRNEYLLHCRVHELFAAGDSIATDVETLNEWVYAELFLTPSSDPWLGLAPTNVYTALEDGGMVDAESGGERITRRGE